MKKNIIKVVVFILILIGIIICLSLFLVNKKTVGKDKISIVGISGERVNSLEYFVLGDSETYTSIIPLEIWHNYGYTGYILGTPAQRLTETKEILEANLVNQKPKLLILETNAIFRKQKSPNSKKSVGRIINNIYKYHDNWKFFVDENFQDYSGNEKGYVYSTKIKKSPNQNYIKVTNKKANIPKENMELFDDIIKICNDNNIKVLLLSTPSSKNWTYKKYNSAKELANKYNLDFVDLNVDNDVSINWDRDTQDEGDHLNYYGASKVTKKLGEVLYNLNILEDYRNNEDFESWDNHYDMYMLKFNNE